MLLFEMIPRPIRNLFWRSTLAMLMFNAPRFAWERALAPRVGDRFTPGPAFFVALTAFGAACGFLFLAYLYVVRPLRRLAAKRSDGVAAQGTGATVIVNIMGPAYAAPEPALGPASWYSSDGKRGPRQRRR